MSGPVRSFPGLPAMAHGLLLSAQARSLLTPELAPRDYLNLLCARNLYADGIQILPQLLDKQRAVWWACLCCWDALAARADAELECALDYAVHWVFDPSEDHRLRLTPEKIAADTPAGCLRMAVVWSSGSMADPQLAVVMPPPHLTARMAAAAVLLAAAGVPREQSLNPYCHYLHMGCDVLEGGLPWLDEPDPSAVELHEVLEAAS